MVKQNLQLRQLAVKKTIPDAICSACHQIIPDEKDVVCIQYLKGTCKMWRIYHKNCYDALVIGLMQLNEGV